MTASFSILCPAPTRLTAGRLSALSDALAAYRGRSYAIQAYPAGHEAPPAFGVFHGVGQVRRGSVSAVELIFGPSTVRAADDDSEALCLRVDKFIQGGK